MGFTTGNAQAMMCSYASVNGVPSCADNFLINQVCLLFSRLVLLVFYSQQLVRQKWGRSDVLVGTDCGSIGNMVTGNHYARNNTDAAAKVYIPFDSLF